MSWLRELLLYSLILQQCLSQNCGSKETCSECIQELGCKWCIKPLSESSSHCVRENEFNSKWCSKEYIRNPKSKITIFEEKSLSDQNGSTVQITPQRVKLTLRKGQQLNFTFQYKQAANYPVDLYYIMDLSASMEKHKEKLGELGKVLAETMTKITSNFQLGFGSFVDKVDLPFVSTVEKKLKNPCKSITCVRPYSFKNHMPLSEDYNKFANEVSRAELSGNLDSPEGGFDAMMQAIVCKEQIRWRPQARHLLVFSTDAEFHIAGDGKLAGVVEPNTAQCHMTNNEYTHYLVEDYPSVSHINYVAKENNINVIFAIVNKTRAINAYDKLSTQIENSEVGILDEESKNVVDLVVGNYRKIVDSVKISSNSSNDVDVKIIPTCKDSIESGCRIHAGEIVTFNVSIKPLECTSGFHNKIIAIKPEAVEESIIVELDIVCDCDCEYENNEFYIPNSPECKNSGNLKCGVCDCNPGFFGQNCECNKQYSTTNDISACIAQNDTKVCSGLGICICGQCKCTTRSNPEEKITGKYCDCDNYSCRKIGGQLCSGRGECTCGGKCNCQAGWTGDACQCPDSISACIKPDNNNLVCNNHGTCNCGKCQCLDEEVRYSGKYCDECANCPSQRCKELKNCVECKVYKEGDFNETECQTNCHFTPNIVEKIEDNDDESTKTCTLVDNQGCTFVFQYNVNFNENNLKVTAEKEKFCPEPPNVLAWVLGVIGSILLAGLIALLIWKVCTTIHDRREYAKFENERQKLRWHRSENPLYKQATSTFSNPVYRKSRNWFKHES